MLEKKAVEVCGVDPLHQDRVQHVLEVMELGLPGIQLLASCQRDVRQHFVAAQELVTPRVQLFGELFWQGPISASFAGVAKVG